MYNFSDLRQILLNCLESIGVTIDDLSDDISFQSLSMDSIMFIMFIVEVEDTLNIAIPSEYLFYDDFISLNGFANKILAILEQNQ